MKVLLSLRSKLQRLFPSIFTIVLCFFVLVPMVVCGLVSCKEEIPDEGAKVQISGETVDNGEYFIVFKHGFLIGIGRLYVLVDKRTRVQYLYIESGHRAGLSVMVDSQGKPILYDELPKVSN